MNSEILSHIFDPFYTTKEKGQGTGLGLLMVFNILEAHRGMVDVASAPGMGTIVDLFLPVSETTGVTPIGIPTEDIPRGSGTILVVEDDPISRRVEVDILSHLGYDVLEAVDGMAGLELFDKAERTIDLVVLDMIMPRAGGWETFHAMRKISPSQKILLISGNDSDDKVKGLLESGAEGFIHKPFTMASLGKAVAKALEVGR